MLFKHTLHLVKYAPKPLMFFLVSLTLYHTIPTFNNYEAEGYGKHCGKRTKFWLQAEVISFFHNVFYPTKDTSYHLSINPFPNKPWFLHVCSMSLLKTPWKKEKLLITSNFSFFHSVFYPLRQLSAIFIK